MPLLKQIDPGKKNILAIWEIDEPIDFFTEALALSPEEQAELDKIKADLKRKQWLAARHLLNSLTPGEQRDPLYKDVHGKPHFTHSGLYMSISHSGDFVVVMLSESECGVDIQLPETKIQHILPRILNTRELRQMGGESDVIRATFLWAAKESIYKAFGLKNLDFRRQILLDPFDFDGSTFRGLAKVKKDDLSINYELTGLANDRFVLSWAIQK